MFNGQEFKILKQIKEIQKRTQEVLEKIEQQKMECISLLCDLEEKRVEVEEYIRERGE